jgi:pyrroloquinoline quinone biosynthesis protein D
MSERIEVRADLVPALPRGVKLRFDQARKAWVLLAPERVLMPDPIAVEILKRCDGKRSVALVIDDLASTFAADRAQIETDVMAFLQDLADKGMVALGQP